MFVGRSVLAMGFALTVSMHVAHAEEGRWTLEQATRPDVRSRLGLRGDDRLAARSRSNMLHFTSGESGTLVSSRGQIATVRNEAAACRYDAGKLVNEVTGGKR
jgi:hypothetical protein